MGLGRGRRRDDRASGTVVSFVVGTAIFVVSSTVLVHFVINQPGSASAPLSTVASDDAAIRALQALVGTPGYPTTWQKSPDTLTRLGLLSEHSTARVDPAKFDALAKGRLYDPSSHNDYVDYDEARAALGLQGYDFHIRAQPVFGLNRSAAYGLDGMSAYHVAYVGDFAAGVPTATSTAEEAAIARLPITFTDTPRPAVIGAGDVFGDSSSSLKGILAPLLGSQPHNSIIPYTGATDAAFHIANASDLATLVTGATSPALALSTTSGDGAVHLGYTAGKDVRVLLGSADLTGLNTATLSWSEVVDTGALTGDPNDYGWIEASVDGGASWIPLTNDQGARSQDAGSVPAAWTPRTLIITGALCAACVNAPDVQIAFHWHADASAVTGRGWAIDNVALSPITTTGFDKTFDAPLYDLVIIGTDVDQTTLASSSMQDAFRDYVNAYGGRLLVLGGHSAPRTDWLSALFDVGIREASPGLEVPDLTHPILTQPNKLDYAHYEDDERSWSFAPGDASLFDVITQAGSSPTRDDLVVSRPYAFGQEGKDGSIVATTYMPATMTAEQASDLIANVLAYGKFHHLYADVGPVVPDTSAVSSAFRTVTMDRSAATEGVFTEIGFTIYVWPGNTASAAIGETRAPTAPRTTASTSDDGVIEVSWTSPDPSSPAYSSFELYRGTSPDVSTLVPVALGTTDFSYEDTDVTNGTTYWYHVLAVSNAGRSSPSPLTSATPGDVPMKPLSLAVIGGVAQTTLSWQAPYLDNGALVTGYDIYRNLSDGSFAFLAKTGGNTTFTDVTLAPGVTYAYEISAENAFGEGPRTSAVGASTTAIPDVPIQLVTTGGLDSITLTWTPPSGTVNYYIVYAGPSTNPTTIATNGDQVGAPTYTETGLAHGETRHYRVRAVNDAGTSSYSDDKSGVTIGLPAQPTPPTLTLPAAGTVNVSWSAVDSSGGTIASYQVYGGNDPLSEALLGTVGGTTLYYIDSGLPAGQTRSYHIIAVNEAGSSLPSLDSTTITLDLPAAPVLTVTDGLGEIDLTWVEDPTSTVSEYRVYGAITQHPSALLATVTGTSYAKTGLADGAHWYFIVRAVNDVGTNDSNEDDGLAHTLPILPLAPTVTATGAGELTISWSTGTGGSPTRYEVNESSDGVTFTHRAYVTAPTTSYVRTGLADGVLRYYTVYAEVVIGADGHGTGDSPPGSGTTLTRPEAPSSVQAVATGTTTVVTWTQTGTATVNNWSVYAGSTADPTTLITNVTSATYTDSGLSPGQTRHYRITANNAAYSSAYSTDTSAVTVSLPGLVGAPTVTPSGKGGLAVSWSAPASGGGTISSYMVNRSASALGPWTTISNASGLSYTNTGLDDGATWYYTVAAWNEVGPGATSLASSGTTYSVPGTPNAPFATGGVGSITITWSAVPGATNYSVYGDTSTTPTTFLTNVTGTTYTESGLANGVSHYYRLKANNPAGSSSYSSTSNQGTSVALPGTTGAPTVAISGRGGLNVSWSAPSNGGGTITGYTVTRSTNGVLYTNVTFVTTPTLYYVNTGLSDNTLYYYEIQASNELGAGSASAAGSQTTMTTPGTPSAPTVAISGRGGLDVTWTAPSNGGGTISSYTVYLNDTGSAIAFHSAASVSGTSTTLTGLKDNTLYYVQIAATNEVGAGSNSLSGSQTTMTTPGTPSAPTVAIDGRGGLDVTWSAPSTGGGTIRGYTIWMNDTGSIVSFHNVSFVTGALTTTVTSLKDATTYYFQVSASNDVGPGSASLSGSHATAAVPTLPTISTAVDAGKTRVWINITAGASDLAITNYTIYKCGPSVTPCSLLAFSQTGGNNISYMDTAVTHATPIANTYWYAVSEWNAVGESTKSVMASASV